MTPIEALIAFAQAEGRICPMPRRWQELWELLPNRKQIGPRWQPPLPLILAAWSETSDSEKRDRFLQHLKYASDHGAFEIVDRFLKSLPAQDWSYAE
jgi:hypothetical protein